MPTYIALLKYTQQGIANVKDSPVDLILVGRTSETGCEDQRHLLDDGQLRSRLIVEHLTMKRMPR